MNTFTYTRPESFAEALDLLYEHGPQARLLAGGTDLLVRIRKGHLAPQIVIDLKHVDRLRRDIQDYGSFLRVGALVVMADLLEDPRLRTHFPALVDAAGTVGSVQIRNRATLAGNICNASPAADTAPALLVYAARVNLAGRDGSRSLPLAEFFTGPGKTVLQRGELVESIDLPLPAEGSGSAFARLTRRRGVDLATVSVACQVKPSGQALFAFGAVAPRPLLVAEPTGRLADPQTPEWEREALLQNLIQAAAPISDLRGSREYRLAMLLVLCRRAIQASLKSMGHG